jgi:hypothetical protein
VGPAASASIWLERSFHFVMTPDFRRSGPASRALARFVNSRRSEINHATPALPRCQPNCLPRTHPIAERHSRRPKNFFLSTPTPYARLRASSGRHRRNAFNRGGVPRTARFPQVLIFLWKRPVGRIPAGPE